jgi:hypothetical protein
MGRSVTRQGVRLWSALVVLLAIGETHVAFADAAAAAEARKIVFEPVLDQDGLQLELGNAPRCVIWPRHLQVTSDCAGIDIAGAARGIDAARGNRASPTVVAVVVWKLPGDQFVLMNVASMPPSTPTREVVGDFLAGIYNSLHSPENRVTKRGDLRLRHDRVTVAAAPAVRYAIETDEGGRALAYMVFGEKRTYTFQFLIPGMNAGPTEALAERLLATMKLPPAALWDGFSTYLLVSLAGAFLLAGIASRVVWRRLGRTFAGAFAAFGVAGLLCAALGSFTVGSERTLVFLAIAGFWFFLDLVRVEPVAQARPQPPASS